MKRISFKPQFVNKDGNDLVSGKIHTIRVNYEYWKKFEGQDLALFMWKGKPYQKGSKQKVFCTKRLVSVQEVYFKQTICLFFPTVDMALGSFLHSGELLKNDGFKTYKGFHQWFNKYESGKLAILHFTDFRY